MKACCSLLFAAFVSVVSSAMADTGQEALERAIKHYHEGALRSAAIETKNALKENPKSPDALVLLGKLYLATGNGEAAEAALVDARENGAAEILTLAPLAEAYIMQRRFDTLYEEIIPTDSSALVRAKVHALYGVAMFEEGRLRTADAEFDIALRLEPRQPEALAGKAALLLAKRERREAREILEKLTASAPNHAKGWYLLGTLQVSAGESEAAMQSFTYAINADPFYSVAQTARAELLLALGNDDAARVDLEKVLEVRPRDPFAHYLRAGLATRQGKLEEATAAMETMEASLRDLGSSYIYKHKQSLYLWGVVNFRNGDAREAMIALQAYLKLSGDGALLARKMLGILHLRKSQARLAIEILTPAAQAQSQDEQLLALLGKAHMLEREVEQATTYLERAVALAPSEPDFQTQLAMAKIADGKQREALKILHSVVELAPESIEAARIIGQFYLRKGQMSKASDWAQKLRARDPSNAYSYNLSGAVLAGQGKFAAAKESFEQAVALQPDDNAAYYNLAELAINTGQKEEGRQRLEDVLSRNPREVRALAQLGDLARETGDIDGAIRIFEKLKAVAPKAVTNQLQLLELYMLNNKYDQARSLGRELVGRFPKNLRAQLGLGRAQLLSGDRRAARSTFRYMSRLANYETEQLQHISGLQVSANDLEGAQFTLQKILQKDPNSVMALAGLAEIEQRLGNWGAALERARLIIQLVPGDPRYYEMVGRLQLQLQAFADAAETFSAGFKVSPSSKLAIGRYLSTIRAKEGNQDEAQKDLRAWVEANPDDVNASLVLGSALVADGKYDDAQALYERTVESSPNDVRPLNSLANLYLKAGNDRALSTAKKALEMAPDSAPVVDTYGWALVRGGNPQEALQYLRKAKSRAPRVAAVRYHLGVALYQLGRGKEAQIELQEALSQDPEFDGALDATELLKMLRAKG